MELAVILLDGDIIDAGFSTPHQSLIIEFPKLVPIGSKPLTICIVVLVLKTYGDPFLAEGPQRLGESIIEFFLPLVTQEFTNLISTSDELVTIPPL